MGFSIKNTTKKAPPKANFEEAKDRILGKRYELSLVFCGDALSRSLNSTYRMKDKPTNVLSFPLSENAGEIFINVGRMKPFGPLHLFIHACLHLKGMRHGRKMEETEKKLLSKFSRSITHGASDRSRN